MIGWGAAALLALMLGIAAPTAEPEPRQYAQLTVREQIVIRVPVRLTQPARVSAVSWKESKGPRCVPARAIAAADRLSESSVDLVLRDRRRFRAKFESRCPALDYYRGFYISPTADGQVCADRDAIRSRMGGQCGIERFRALEAVRRD